MNKTIKAIGAGMAVGGVAAAITNAVTSSSMKRTIKKTVKKVGSGLTDVISSAQDMMK